MRAMVLNEIKQPLRLTDVPIPSPKSDEVLLRVSACGVCRTDLHVVDGDLPTPHLPLIPGHQIVGEIVEMGSNVKGFHKGQRVGVPWLGETCGHCSYCIAHKENLCDNAIFTGYGRNGGFAEYCTTHSQFIFPLPDFLSDELTAPLLCAGLIGYRALRLTENAQTIGFYGFGASAHILAQVAVYQKKKVYAFTRPGDKEGQDFALSLGAVWAGSSDALPPELLEAAIIFAPDGKLVPIALKALKKGGIVVCAGIHMSDIPSFPYRILWGERMIRSVANLTREDGEEFLAIAPRVPIHTIITEYPLEKVNEALNDLRSGRLKGAAVIRI